MLAILLLGTDLIPYFVAFIACLVMPLELGILAAIGVNLLFILYHSARPKVRLETLEVLIGHIQQINKLYIHLFVCL